MDFKSKLVVKSILLIITLSISNNILAQGGLLEEVIVTAQKREQSVQDVGIAITAISGEQMDALGFSNSIDIARYSPGVSMSGGGGDQRNEFTIRGATQNDFADHAESPNALYVDEVYQAAQQAQLFAQFDMQRVEVLKGPQGTLFGRNATGGLIHFVTNKPSQEFESYADITYGTEDTIQAEAAVSGGVSDTISMRLSGVYSGYDDLIDNPFTPADLPPTAGLLQALGRPATYNPTIDINDKYGEETFGFRGQMLFEPNDDVEFLLQGNYGKQEFSAAAYNSIPTVAFVDDTDGDGVFDDVVNTDFQNNVRTTCEQVNVNDGSCVDTVFDGDLDGVRPNDQGDLFGQFDPDPINDFAGANDHTPDPGNKIKMFNVSGKLTWDLDFAKLVSVSAFSNIKHRQSLDVGDAPVPQFIFFRETDMDWFSQEIRLEGEEERFRWIAGAYYLNIDVKAAQGLADTIGGLNIFGGYFFGPVFNSDNGVPFFVPGIGGNPISLLTGEPGTGDTFVEATTDTDLKTNSYSLFGHIDFDLTDQLALTVGFRGIIEEKDFSFTNRLYRNVRDGRSDGAQFAGAQPFSFIFTPAGVPADFLDPFSDKTSDFLWSGKIQLNYSPTDDLLFYGGVNRGIKAGNFNGPLLTGLTQDEYGYKEEVLLSYEAGFKSSLLGGKARLNFSAYYYDYKDYQAFQFVGTSGAVFNTDAEYWGFEVELIANPTDQIDLWLGLSYIDPEVQNLEVADNVFRNVEPTFTPQVQFSGVGRYTWPEAIMGGSVSLQLDGSHASSSFSNINNFDSHRMPASWIGNSRIQWESADGRWRLAGFVKNFSDSRTQTSTFDLATIGGADEISFERPRWGGVNVRYSY
jgi:iron complex outermembrane recepter protein